MRTFGVTRQYTEDWPLTRIFSTGLSFRMCIEKNVWPSLKTMNSFLMNGVDDMNDGGLLRWAEGEIEESEYTKAIEAVMQGRPYRCDDDQDIGWADWFEELAIK